MNNNEISYFDFLLEHYNFTIIMFFVIYQTACVGFIGLTNIYFWLMVFCIVLIFNVFTRFKQED